MIITVDLVRGIQAHVDAQAAVIHVVANQFPGDTVRRVPTFEFRRIVAAGNVLKYNSIKYSSAFSIGESPLFPSRSPGSL